MADKKRRVSLTYLELLVMRHACRIYQTDLKHSTQKRGAAAEAAWQAHRAIRRHEHEYDT